MSMSDLIVVAVGFLALYGVLWISFMKPAADTSREEAAEMVTDTLIARQARRAARRAQSELSSSDVTTASAYPTTCPNCAGRQPDPFCPTCQGFGSPEAARLVRGLRREVSPADLAAQDLHRLAWEVTNRRREKGCTN